MPNNTPSSRRIKNRPRRGSSHLQVESVEARVLMAVVTNTNDAGPGSLRQAIIDTNANAADDTIDFAITGPGRTISLLSPLDTISDSVTIDGTTQGGVPGIPPIILDGTEAGANAVGLTISSGTGGSTIRGLQIAGFGGGGISTFTGGNLIAGNYIGNFVAGAGAQSTGISLFVGNNTIGGTTAADRNVISGNTGVGISILGSGVVGNLVQGNYIGTNAAGTGPLGNGSFGIGIASPGNTIGGTTAGARNIVSGNLSDGIRIEGSGAAGNLVQGNYVGINAAGNAALGNAGDGIIMINGPGANTIGGTAAGAGNVVSGNGSGGISMFDPNNLVQGNLVGTNAAGNAALGNAQNGVFVGDSAGNIIGGAAAGARNIVSGNSQGGVRIQRINVPTTGNLVLGNYIGTNLAGNAAIGNGTDGVVLDADSNRIGGTLAGERNLISGNRSSGLSITGATNLIQGNYVGTDASGLLPVPNESQGVFIAASFNTPGDRNTIGGTAAGAGNLISANRANGVALINSNNFILGNRIGTNAVGLPGLGNGQSGVFVLDAGNSNQILSNAIASNGQLGIDLGGGGGVRPNLPGGPHTGANRGQNYPVLTSAITTPGATVISGTLNSNPNTTFIVELFANDTPDPSGYGEGQTLLTSPVNYLTVTTDSAGNATFTFTVPRSLAGQYITATATSNINDTSEFSLAQVAGPTIPAGNTTVTEGASGQTVARVTFGLSVASRLPVVVTYTTVDGTATTADGDYVPTSGTLTFAPGQTIASIDVLINGDLRFENDEFFYVILGTATNATIGDRATLVTISNDDPLPTVIADDVTVFEGDQGLTTVNLVYRLSAPSSLPASFDIRSVDGTAIAGVDYVPFAGRITFAPGQTVQQFTISVIGDLVVEPDEFFLVQASNPVNAILPASPLRVTIANDDSFVVTNTNDSGRGSLRQAILNANFAPGTDTITFDLPGEGGRTIRPITPLPGITDTVVIDGIAQPALAQVAFVSPQPLVEIDGRGIGDPASGLLFLAGSSGSIVSGLSIFGFRGPQISLVSDDNTISANYLGLRDDGTIPEEEEESGSNLSSPFNTGLLVLGNGSTIQGNVISGNAGNGVVIRNEGTGRAPGSHQLVGNLIGLDPTGTLARGNGVNGILVEAGVRSVRILAGNVVSANRFNGIELVGAIDTTISGTFIGTAIDGTTATGQGGGSLGNTGAGICVDLASIGTLIGDASGGEATRNVISGNGFLGIAIRDGSTGTRVVNSHIGTDKAGTSALGNGSTGILISNASGNTIGGTSAAERNVISGNGSRRDGAGVWIESTDPANLVVENNSVQGNFIGVDATGSRRLGNATIGVLINVARNNRIGGEAPNVISANGLIGVMISGPEATGNLVAGNLIGTDANGTAGLGNGNPDTEPDGAGVYINGAPGNTIGGTADGARNVISGNQGDGILIFSADASANLVEGNFVGTDSNGATAIPNRRDGVVIFDAPGNTLRGNVISGNRRNGVILSGDAATENQLAANRIGLGFNGEAIGNGRFGLLITSGSRRNVIEPSNQIANNVSGEVRNATEVPSSANPLDGGNTSAAAKARARAKAARQKAREKAAQARAKAKAKLKIQARAKSFGNRALRGMHGKGIGAASPSAKA